MSTLHEFEHAQSRLSQEITSLKKQSVLALAVAVAFIILSIVLLSQVKQANRELEVMNDSIQGLNKTLNAWRVSLIQTKPPQTTDASAPIVPVIPVIPEDHSFVIIDKLPENKELDKFKVPSLTGDNLTTTEKKLSELKEAAKRVKPHTSEGYEIAVPIVVAERPKPFFGLIVYIHDRKGSQVSDTLKAALIEKGAIVPSIQHIGNKMAFGNAVKYFHPNESQTAETLKNQLDQILGKKAIQARVPVRYLANDKVPIGQFEVWIDK